MIYYIQKLKWVSMTFVRSKSSSNEARHKTIQLSSRSKISCLKFHVISVISLLTCNLLTGINRAKFHNHIIVITISLSMAYFLW